MKKLTFLHIVVIVIFLTVAIMTKAYSQNEIRCNEKLPAKEVFKFLLNAPPKAVYKKLYQLQTRNPKAERALVDTMIILYLREQLKRVKSFSNAYTGISGSKKAK